MYIKISCQTYFWNFVCSNYSCGTCYFRLFSLNDATLEIFPFRIGDLSFDDNIFYDDRHLFSENAFRFVKVVLESGWTCYCVTWNKARPRYDLDVVGIDFGG